MSKALTLSIVIPVYNEQNHLKACLESIAKQTVEPNEVIVVDNNSTDESVTVAKTFPFVTLVTAKDQGVMWARNKGFDTATSVIIGRIDADTQLPSDWTEKVLDIFTDEMIDAVTGPVGWHDAPAKQLGLFIDKSIRKITWRIGSKDSAVFLFGSNMAMRREVWQAVRNSVCMRKDVHEDVDLAIHTYEAGYGVVFDPSLTAMTSSRRMNDSAEDLRHYIAVYKNTYTSHNIKTVAIALPTVITLSTHYGVKLIKRGYDPETQDFSLRKFLDARSEPRIHPM